ncbi:MAG: glycosyltransferase family 39 protein [Proteobacteria bacterium]|nr:glycosyltransferase family 39 protein [Pseudomonadota bacterium]
MISLVIWGAILSICFGVGAAILARLRAQSDTWAEEIPFAVALGLGLLAYLMLIVGLLAQLKLWVGVALLCLLTALGWRHLLRLAGAAREALLRPKSWRWAALPLLLFFLAAGALSLIGSLAPAADLDYDSLVYHLTIPNIYLRDGNIHPIPWLSHSNFPFTLEMLYLLGLLLHDQTLAKLFHFACGWLTVCAVFAFGRRWWGARAGWLGAALFAAVPLVAWEMMTAYSELAFALYAFLTIYALARWFEGRAKGEPDGWLYAGALLCGLALGIKMLAATVLLFATAALFWHLLREPKRRGLLLRAFVFAAIAAAVASPWYLKSYLWTGNPVYPFMYELFGGTHWTAERAHAYTEAQKAFGLGQGPLAFAALPWNLTMQPRWFFDLPQVLRPFNIFVMVFGPLLLAFLPVLPLTGPVGKPGRLLLWFALFYITIWFGLSQNGRYLIPILPGLCACAGLAASRLLDRRGVASPAVLVALLLALSSGLYASFNLSAPAWRVALGRERPEEYLSKAFPNYPMFDLVNRVTPPDAKLLVLGDEPRCFYLQRDFLFGNHAEIFTEADTAGPDQLLATLGRLGVTHLLLDAAVVNNMDNRAGRIEAALADLRSEGKLRKQGRYRSLSLWVLAGESAERSR